MPTSTSANRPGFSACAARTSPHTGASRTSTSSPGSATAPRVTTTSRDAANRSSASHACTTSSTSPTTDRTPSGTSVSGTGHSNTTASGTSAPSAGVPQLAHGTGLDGTGAGTHSTRNSESESPPRAASSCSAETGRETRESTVATGRPVSSAISIAETSSPLSRWMRTRTAEAPAACSLTPFQVKGRSVAPPSGSRSTTRSACMALSSSAGCSPNLPASSRSCSGSATSANTSSPRRQAAFSPWNAGPYP
ncbi:hypothetical protein PS9374_07174 [Planomonospora sphaerica]|uniref:Uncharacterized protein n=1 Tax=Planomonospora sphaerica TaxID=161355 RepID=A0A161MFX9_9ACTN|nr:hypothetical protein PS9374_07174 [Planomonospora sphaerica]